MICRDLHTGSSVSLQLFWTPFLTWSVSFFWGWGVWAGGIHFYYAYHSLHTFSHVSHVIIWFTTVVRVFLLVVSLLRPSCCQNLTLWLNTTWFPQERLSVSQLISSGCDDFQHMGLVYKHQNVLFYIFFIQKWTHVLALFVSGVRHLLNRGGEKKLTSHSHNLSCFKASSIQGTRSLWLSDKSESKDEQARERGSWTLST